MLINLSLIFVFINSINCQVHLQRNYAPSTALEETTNLFENLRADYALANSNEDALSKIHGEVTNHMRNVLKKYSARYKRETPEVPNKGIDVLNGFQNFEQLNFTDVQDILFFSLQNKLQLNWFTVILDKSKISVYQINNHTFQHVAAYALPNARQIIAHTYAYEAFLIAQSQDDSILILRFMEVEEKYYMYLTQDIEYNDVTHLTTWQGINQLFLAIASHSNISIFIWFNDYFDLAQVINHGTSKLIPFCSKGFMYLAVTGPTTLILKHSLRSKEFEVTQRLPSSQDVSSFQLIEGHFIEHFLCLSMESSVVIYKETHDRFIPFQRISPVKFAVPIIFNKAIVLLAFYKDTISTYQYDGWRFVELNIKLTEIRQFRQIVLHGKELLLMEHKNHTWSLKQPVWTDRKSYKDLQEEIRAWIVNATNTARRTSKVIPESKGPIKILKGHIDQIFIRNINEHNSQALKDVSKQYKKVVSKLQEQKEIMNNKLLSDNVTLPSLHVKSVRVKCKAKCKVKRLNIRENSDLLSKLKMRNNSDSTRTFKAVSVKEVKNSKCPLFSFPIEDVIVDKTINGVSLDELQANTLKVNGNQEVSGKHIFYHINVTDAFMLLNIAKDFIKQEVHAKEIRVKELNVTSDGVLLSLNGPSTTMNGLIKASKIKVKGIINLSGPISGDFAKPLSPVMTISEPMTLESLTLANAKIEHLKAGNLIANKAGSVKDILSNAVSLHNNVPVSLVLSTDRLNWTHVTFHGSQNWITANSSHRVNITGRKRILHNAEIRKSTYKNLKLPEIEAPLCGTTIIAPRIETTVLAVNDITVKRLKSSRVLGNLGERYFTQNLTSFFKPFDLAVKRFYHNVTVKDMSATYMNNVDLTEIKRLANLWIEPNILKSSIETNFVVNTLRTPVHFRTELPKIIKNIISEKNIDVVSVNNVNLMDFLADAVKLEDMISLGNITFYNGFTTNHIYTSHLPLNLMQLEENTNLYKKQISGNIEANEINLPYFVSHEEDKVAPNILITGSAILPREPLIKNINDINLEGLLARTWMATHFTIFHGKNLHVTSAAMKRSNAWKNSSNTLNPETWMNISKRFLSKTRPQEIIVSGSLKSVEAPVIMGSNTSAIKSFVSDFNDTFDNALVKHKQQKVEAKWTFNKLKILDKLHARGNINNMNLKTDVMRHDIQENIVTGKKTVVVLTAENLSGLNFDEWADNALMRTKKFTIVKGRKSFNTVTINNMNVSGTIMGRNIEKALLKSADQTLLGLKTIQGSLHASKLVINGLVNDVNLTDLINRQLRKQKPSQVIRSRVDIQNSLKIFGSLTLNDSYGKAELKESYKTYSNIAPVAEKMWRYSKTSETMNVALRNRAVYINKLEVVKETNVIDASNKNVTLQKDRCTATNSSKLCASEHIVNALLESNPNDFVLIKSISLNMEEFIVWIKFDSVSIYSYNSATNGLSHLKDLHIPNIIDGFVESMFHSLWIVLRLSSQTLVLHYQPWNEVQEYVLPVTDVFTMSRSPNDQLLLFLSDGVWNLKGLESPQNIIKIPLKGEVETFVDGFNYYIKCRHTSNATLMKARYIGN
ncbi:uncharacterized protein LOC128881831 [Hylaeus volcanicus]|uniref:uncharacterized protein LOC128881831 n=1 Tax=Hylaeus volcanicus TaxID=313075 RepID=UPI0023B7AD53|nr:uncharacterized protein LOC128881831 [Hylaeus volcanicus]